MASALAFSADRALVILELQDQVPQIIILDEGRSLESWKPPNRSLLAFRPFLQLSLDQQRKDLNLTWKRCRSFLKPFLVHVAAERPSGDPAADAGLLISLTRGCPGRLVPLDRPTFWDDPLSRTTGGDEQDLDASLQNKPIRQRSDLNTSWPMVLWSLPRNGLVLRFQIRIFLP